MPELSTLATALVLGSVTCFFFCFYVYRKLSGVVIKKDSKHSEPLAFSISSVYEFASDVSKLALMMLLVYLCENFPPHPHSQKVHDMDMFWVMTAVLFLWSFTDVRKSKTTDILNREQTEEWKGWMQFMFLLYHYFSAHEVYNSIRVMITCYVWMTGFGNFSFFYIKRDFGALRFLQMLWRLNFLVFFLCMTLGNNYILYYICPLHTFYFFLVFATMGIWQGLNHTKWGIRIKLFVVALVIYTVWDLNSGIFKGFFGLFLSQDPVVGATSGTLYEWYFRTSLDHWSTYLGMIFALNFPMATAWLKVTEAMPAKTQLLVKGLPALVAIATVVWWSTAVLPLPKLDYNAGNAYFAWVPMVCYIFLRNLHPALRQWYLHPLHNIGKITLETYLCQHHLWLTSNAKTLLNILPAYPKVNLVAAGALYVGCSQELHRLTMSLRGALLPDRVPAPAAAAAAPAAAAAAEPAGPLKRALRNMAGVTIAYLLAYALAFTLKETGLPIFECLTVMCSGLGVGSFWLIIQKLPKEDDRWRLPEDRDEGGGGGGGGGGPGARARRAAGGGAALALLTALALGAYLAPPAALSSVRSPSSRGGAAAAASFSGTAAKCAAAVNEGHWTARPCDTGKSVSPGVCTSHAWVWNDIPDNCHIRSFDTEGASALLKGKKVAVVGDSVGRKVHYALARALGAPAAEASDAQGLGAGGADDLAKRHADLAWETAQGPPPTGTSLAFTWAPYAEDLRTTLERLSNLDESEKPDVLLMTNGLWDALHHPRELASGYKPALEASAALAPGAAATPGALRLWLAPTAVVDARLGTPEKKEFMTEAQVAPYRQAAAHFMTEPPLLEPEKVAQLVAGDKLTAGRAADCYDGVHYSEETYDLFAQVVLNLVEDHEITLKAAKPAQQAEEERKPHKHKPIGLMANPRLGLGVLAAIAVCLVSMDAYLGVPAAALRLLVPKEGAGGDYTWAAAYGGLHRSLGLAAGGSGGGAGSDGVELPRFKGPAAAGAEQGGGGVGEREAFLAAEGGEGEEEKGAGRARHRPKDKLQD